MHIIDVAISDENLHWTGRSTSSYAFRSPFVSWFKTSAYIKRLISRWKCRKTHILKKKHVTSNPFMPIFWWNFFCKLLGCRLVKPTAVVAWLPVPRQHGSNINGMVATNAMPSQTATNLNVQLMSFTSISPPKKRCLLLLLSEHICWGRIDPRDWRPASSQNRMSLPCSRVHPFPTVLTRPETVPGMA